MILDFLDHLEVERGNSPRTRNLRLTAIRSFLRYVSVRDPTALAVAQRVLAIPTKNFDRPVLGYFSREEVEALLDAPDRSTWSGQRDAVLFAVFYNTGARVSEVITLTIADILLDRAFSLLRSWGEFRGSAANWAVSDTREGRSATEPLLVVWQNRVKGEAGGPCRSALPFPPSPRLRRG